MITLLAGYRFFKNKSGGMDVKKYRWINGNTGRKGSHCRLECYFVFLYFGKCGLPYLL